MLYIYILWEFDYTISIEWIASMPDDDILLFSLCSEDECIIALRCCRDDLLERSCDHDLSLVHRDQ